MCHGFLVHFAYIFIKLKRPNSQRNLRLSDEITDKLQNCTVSCDKALYQTLMHYILFGLFSYSASVCAHIVGGSS